MRILRIVDDAIEMNVLVDCVAEALPGWRFYLKDQLRRAALSCALNLAEGGAEHPPAEKARFYRMALRSMAEVAVALRIAARLHPELERPVITAFAAINDLSPRCGHLVMSMKRRK